MGRHKAFDEETEAEIREMIVQGTPSRAIMERFGVGRTFVQVRARALGQPYARKPAPDHPWRQYDDAQ